MEDNDFFSDTQSMIVNNPLGCIKGFTPRKINIEPEHDGLEDDFPFPGVYSQVPC